MQLTPQDIEELKAAYKEAFEEQISDSEAQEMAQRMLWLFELLMEKPRANPTQGGSPPRQP